VNSGAGTLHSGEMQMRSVIVIFEHSYPFKILHIIGSFATEQTAQQYVDDNVMKPIRIKDERFANKGWIIQPLEGKIFPPA
jgi:hypothetical protein